MPSGSKLLGACSKYLFGAWVSRLYNGLLLNTQWAAKSTEKSMLLFQDLYSRSACRYLLRVLKWYPTSIKEVLLHHPSPEPNHLLRRHLLVSLNAPIDSRTLSTADCWPPQFISLLHLRLVLAWYFSLRQKGRITCGICQKWGWCASWIWRLTQ